jgi:UDP-N-acetylglucosamine 2-epimerase (non-hydrolysing)
MGLGKLNVLFVFGTRPEAIKMAPVIKAFQNNFNIFDVKICSTAQHREMLDQVLDFFKIAPDHDLNLMRKDQSLFDITADGLKGLEGCLNKTKPDLIFVQGDTTSAFMGALAGFYKKISVAHIEAGLRSGNKYSPFPEEINRMLAGRLSDYHFAPTTRAKENLIKEGITENVFVVGNSVIDALFMGLNIVKHQGDDQYFRFFNEINFSKKIILVTGHRRESIGQGFENICIALKEISSWDDVEIVYPVHLNPNVRDPVNRILSGMKNIHLIEPLTYPYLIWLLNKSHIVLTDSGGIQEEAPSLGKPVIVMRAVTERVEGIEAGTAKLTGTCVEKIVIETKRLLRDQEEYMKMARAVNPYGDGKSSEHIVNYFKDRKHWPRNPKYL